MPRGMVPPAQSAVSSVYFLTLSLLLIDCLLLGSIKNSPDQQMETSLFWKLLGFLAFSKDLLLFIFINSGHSAGLKFMEENLFSFGATVFLISAVVGFQFPIWFFGFGYWTLMTSFAQAVYIGQMLDEQEAD